MDWWTGVEPGRVVRLEGSTADRLRKSLDPLPIGAPAIVWCRSADAGSGTDRVYGVEGLLDEIERAAIRILPLWLPDSAGIVSPQGAGVAAVRSIAADIAARSTHYGPFLADLAERALRAASDTLSGVDVASARVDVAISDHRFPAPTRAAALALVIAASHKRSAAAALFEIPSGLPVTAEESLTAAASWIAYHGGWIVGLVPVIPTAKAPRANDSAEPSAISPSVSGRRAESGLPDRNAPIHSRVTGAPRPDSPAELALEAALRNRPWAGGRAWNRTYQSGPLAPSYRLDLWWEHERCVIEVDGPEHRSAERYEADRRRDVQLQLDGQSVLRFTNDHVLTDVVDVLTQIERLLRSRRPRPADLGDQSTCQPSAPYPS
ncbi:endonuclease domain-containing protein [Catenulispora pinisilvae]|uniref:endonuclease domain-containing protein n=1 Tax=Catenulispora pinisilvae TaxID=2705253 RepID=UPI001890F977|nr:DUF559 domain-containing protein [Catenulispora pinisilvae]